MKRRDFLKVSATTIGVGAMSGIPVASASDVLPAPAAVLQPRQPNERYSGQHLNRVAFPMGGFGAGMICLEGTGALSHFSLRNRPEVFNEPLTFAAVSIKGSPQLARVLEGPVPGWKKFGLPGSGNGAAGTSYGLPRFREAEFEARFPFAKVFLSDKVMPLRVELTGWSPFEPGDEDNASLPVAALEYALTNTSSEVMEGVFSWNARNFMTFGRNKSAIKPTAQGFILWCSGPADRGWEEGAFSATVDSPDVEVNHAWFRGDFFDPLTIAWKDIKEARCYGRAPLETDSAPGATLFVPFKLSAGETRTICLRFAWYVGRTQLRLGRDPAGEPANKDAYKPWYAGRFANLDEVTSYWREHYQELRANSQRFSQSFYDSTLPPEVIEAVAANLSILKSPTVLRQADGRLWGWEGCSDGGGCCEGSCTHVWNYAQSIPHLFPRLERSLRETEFGPSQDPRGHQQFRSALPIRPVAHDFRAAADGQLGGILKVYREWRLGGDTEWLRRLWPKVRTSLNYCIETWDPAHKGWLEEPHHNTYDIEFWGPDGMCTSFYLGALKAATLMAKALADDASEYTELLKKGLTLMETDLFDGEYFFQKVQWKGLRAKSPLEAQGGYSPEAAALLEKEGPKYQYGKGCLSDGVLGAWLASMCGVPDFISPDKIASHLKAVHKYNLRTDLSFHSNPQRPSYACGAEGGLLLCTWPKGGEPSLPFVYAYEVWTGFEYQVAAHLMSMGLVSEGREIVRVARARYDGQVRNPFDEYECGHWYARAMSSYGMIQALTGARYDAVEKVLYLKPSLVGDFQGFISTESGYGHVGVRDGKPFLDVTAGKIPITSVQYSPQS